MERETNILIFPCGSGIGLEICQSLCQIRNINIIGCSSLNSDPNPSIAWLNKYYGDLPFLNDEENLLKKLYEIVIDNKIDFIFPGYDDAIIFFTKNSQYFKNSIILSSSYEINQICRSKSLTYKYLKNDIKVPEVYNIDQNLNYPIFVKPDKGQGSFGAKKINDHQELIKHCKSIDDPLLLEFLPGKEYTIDCFSDRESGLIFSGIRERLRIVNGICTATKMIEIPEIKTMAKIIQKKLSIYGSWFFQVKYSKENIPCLLEISPRIAGCMAFYRGLGINFPLLSIYESQRKPIEIIDNKIPDNNLLMTKIYQNYYHHNIKLKNVYVDLDDTLIIKGCVNTKLIQFLYQCINKNINLYLITRNVNPYEILRKYHISVELFSEIICIKSHEKKSTFIKTNNGEETLFIDDSFNERRDVKNNVDQVFVIDCSSLDIFLDLTDKNSFLKPNNYFYKRDVLKNQQKSGVKISNLDQEFYIEIRKNVSQFLKDSSFKYCNENHGILLDIAPQEHKEYENNFSNIKIETLDIDPTSNSTYTADITKNNEKIISSNKFDYVICVEVLEHTYQPFDSILEIYRILKNGGLLFLSVPFNFRIHGPLPDCWRISEYGLKTMLDKYFNIIEFNALEFTQRPLFPIHYTIVARKKILL